LIANFRFVFDIIYSFANLFASYFEYSVYHGALVIAQIPRGRKNTLGVFDSFGVFAKAGAGGAQKKRAKICAHWGVVKIFAG